MRTVRAKQNQTVYDVALEQYGNVEAVAGIMATNTDLRNDPAALAALGIDAIGDDGFYMDAALLSGSRITIDPDSPLSRPTVLKEIAGEEITTFDLQ